MSSNCHFPEHISLFIFYLHSFWLWMNKFNVNWIKISLNMCIYNIPCCSKLSVVENVSSEWLYASPCSYHRVFIMLLKKLWKKFSFTFKKFCFLCLLPSLFSFLASPLRLIRLLIFATLLLTMSLITPSAESKSVSALQSWPKYETNFNVTVK